MTQFGLKPKERQQLLAGHYPDLVRPEKPELGEIVLKSSRAEDGASIPELSIELLSTHKQKKGGWRVEYLVKDFRGVYAAQGLGYTRSPVRALDSTAPILDPEVIEGYAQEATQGNALRQAEHVRQQKLETAEAKAGRGLRAEQAAIRAKRRAEQ